MLANWCRVSCAVRIVADRHWHAGLGSVELAADAVGCQVKMECGDHTIDPRECEGRDTRQIPKSMVGITSSGSERVSKGTAK